MAEPVTAFPGRAGRAQVEPPAQTSPIRRNRRRALRAVGIGLLAIVLLASVDAAALVIRVDRFSIPATASPAAGETWVVVGTDSRAHKPRGEDIYKEGGIPGGAGERADIVLVLRVAAGEPTRVVSVPRDLILPRSVEGGYERIAASLEVGEAELVNALCEGLGIPTDHLVKVTLRGFVETVDALGGLTVNLEYSTKDFYSYLEPTGAGRQTLDGNTALSFVRSRHPEYLIDGEWQAASLAAGSATRASNAAIVLDALRRSAKGALANPVRLQRTAWAVSGGFQLDKGTPLWSLATLARSAGEADLVTLPGEATGTQLALLPDESTYRAVERAGYAPGSCQVTR
jgi:LCP family protein required for cell wall assembly